jgi:pyruvate kinase
MGPQFAELELEKIATVRKAGFTRWFLSYVEGKRDVDEFLSLVGRDAEVMLKIENQKGLDYVARGFKKRENLRLVAARGDLYIELARPHEIPTAMRTIISKDPDACVGSRILLSVVQEPILEAFNMLIRKDPDAAVKARDLLAATQRPGVPSCADFQELAGLYDIGFRTFMLCDELCLKERLLATAVNAFEAFRKDYVR